jgi:TonB family protein
MSQTMNTPAGLGKTWAGKVVDRKFPLRQWLGGSDHSTVFLTERPEARKAAIKLIPAKNLDEDAQLSRWASIAKLSHPHLMQLFEWGRCQIDGTRLLYVVMECAEENLGEVLPVRPLSPAEASEMLPPVAQALGQLHRAGFVHTRIAPSNITAVDNQLKLSTDSIRKIGEVDGPRSASAYDAPEVAITGPSAAADIWSLGVTLLAVMTQNAPKVSTSNGSAVAVPKTIPPPLYEIARQCLQIDPQQRGTVHDILRRLRAPSVTSAAKVEEQKKPRHSSNRWILAGIVLAALLLGVWLSVEILVHRAPTHATDSQSAISPGPADTPATQSPVPFSSNGGQNGVTRGSVLQKVEPEVSRNALNTITGRLKVSVKVAVDASGNVTQANFFTHGPSQYFANKALAAAERWKFNPPQVDGRPAASEWLLHFQFGRTSIQILSEEVKP